MAEESLYCLPSHCCYEADSGDLEDRVPASLSAVKWGANKSGDTEEKIVSHTFFKFYSSARGSRNLFDAWRGSTATVTAGPAKLAFS